MFSLFFGGRNAPPSVLPSQSLDGPIRPDEARLRAWAVALGEIRPHLYPPARRVTHRGMLPDVDMAQVVPAPRRASWRARLMRLLFGRRLPLACPPPLAPADLESLPNRGSAIAAARDGERPGGSRKNSTRRAA